MFKFIISIMFFACLHAVAGSPTNLQLRQVAAPAGFDITNLGVSTPCLPGSADSTLSADKSALTVTFSNYFTRVGPGLPVLDWHRNCHMAFDVVVPPGFRFELANVEYRAYHQLDVNVTASHRASYYFPGAQSQRANAFSVLTGPLTGANYTYRDNFAPAAQVLSPCGAGTQLNINSDIRTLNGLNRAGSGFISAHDSPSFSQTFNFQWKTC